MAEGWVKDFNSEAGYGFITPDGGGPDLLVHYYEIQIHGYQSLDTGERVSYAVEADARGRLHAVKVTPLGQRMPGPGTTGRSPAARPGPAQAWAPRLSRPRTFPLTVTTIALAAALLLYTIAVLVADLPVPGPVFVLGAVLVAILVVGRLLTK